MQNMNKTESFTKHRYKLFRLR